GVPPRRRRWPGRGWCPSALRREPVRSGILQAGFAAARRTAGESPADRSSRPPRTPGHTIPALQPLPGTPSPRRARWHPPARAPGSAPKAAVSPASGYGYPKRSRRTKKSPPKNFSDRGSRAIGIRTRIFRHPVISLTDIPVAFHRWTGSSVPGKGGAENNPGISAVSFRTEYMREAHGAFMKIRQIGKRRWAGVGTEKRGFPHTGKSLD